MRGQARIAAVQPRIAELRAKYARQPDKLQAELGALYAREAGGMLAGCLPLLLQLPFFSVMYRLFLSGTVSGKANELLHRTLLRTPLGRHWLSGPGPVSGQGLVFLGLFALLAVIAWLSARAARSAAGSPAGLVPAPRTGAAVAKTAVAKTGTARSSTPKAGTGQAASQVNPAGLTAITRLLPFTTLVIAGFVPLAAGLYLLTTSAWTLAERVALRRRIAPPANDAALPMAGSAR